MRKPMENGFCFHEHAALVQHLKRIARGMADGENDMVCFDIFAVRQGQALHLAVANIKIGDMGAKSVFAAQRARFSRGWIRPW